MNDSLHDAEQVMQTGFSLLAPPSPYSITFFDKNAAVGKLTFDNGIMSFTGNADAAAEVFFNELVRRNNADIERLRAQVAAGDALRLAMADVPEDMFDWGGYASDYMQCKHGLYDDVTKYKKALADYDASKTADQSTKG